VLLLVLVRTTMVRTVGAELLLLLLLPQGGGPQLLLWAQRGVANAGAARVMRRELPLFFLLCHKGAWPLQPLPHQTCWVGIRKGGSASCAC